MGTLLADISIDKVKKPWSIAASTLLKFVYIFISSGLAHYWTDLTKEVEEIYGLFKNATQAVVEQGREWLEDTAEDVIVSKMTQGKQTLVCKPKHTSL